MAHFAERGLVTDHPPIVAVNGHAADPHYVPSARTPTPIRRGDLLLIDLWAKEPGASDPYADITWVAYCGDRPPAWMYGLGLAIYDTIALRWQHSHFSADFALGMPV